MALVESSYGYYFVTHKRPSRSESWIKETDDGLETLIYPDSLEQYAGPKDKNGKELYQADIIQDFPNGSEPRELFRVDWSDFRWVLKFRHPFGAWVSEQHFKDAFHMKVIANVYENPELLNKQPAPGAEQIE
jgi:hypothetical protein